MNYNEALDFIHGALKLGSKLGLSNIRELLRRLGSPDKKLKFIHVAGTNGKGTVTNVIARILIEQGYRVGIYTSPFVHYFNERIAINGKLIENEDIAFFTSLVKKACDDMVNDGLSHPTEFELVTALGLLYFAHKSCDFVVLEVGLGGRLDATNVIDKPLCAVITSISFDHMEYLGDTISKIATEKCGIIKDGSYVSVYPEQDDEAMSIIEKTCKDKNANLVVADMPNILESDLSGSVFDYKDYKKLRLNLIGEHMVKNAVTAIEAIEILRKQGIEVCDESIRKGVEAVKWKGRFEVISKEPLIILDGAHNISGIEAFKKTVEQNLEGKKLVFIMGMLSDKEYDESVKRIAPLAEFFITVDVPSPRTLPAKDLAQVVLKYNDNVYAAKDVKDAVSKAYAYKANAILTFGSLYLLGDIKREFENQKK